MTVTEKLEELGFQVSSELVEDNYNGSEGTHTYRVTIGFCDNEIVGRLTYSCLHRHHPDLQVAFKPYQSACVSHAQRALNLQSVPDTPELSDVLHIMVTDASAANQKDFGQFCREFGYNPDSIKALEIFSSCLDSITELKSLGVCSGDIDHLFWGYRPSK